MIRSLKNDAHSSRISNVAGNVLLDFLEDEINSSSCRPQAGGTLWDTRDSVTQGGLLPHVNTSAEIDSLPQRRTSGKFTG